MELKDCIPGTRVYLKNIKNQIGEVVSIYRGKVIVVWYAADDPNICYGSSMLSHETLLSEKEVQEELDRQAAQKKQLEEAFDETKQLIIDKLEQASDLVIEAQEFAVAHDIVVGDYDTLRNASSELMGLVADFSEVGWTSSMNC